MKKLKSEKRCDHILDVALELFVKKGYNKTGLSDIIKKSGGSLSTLYQKFGSKEGLLQTMIERKAEGFKESLEECVKSVKNEKDLKTALIKVATEYVKLTNGKNILELQSVVVHQNQNEAISAMFCDLAMKPIFHILITLFKRPEFAKELNNKDYELLTFRFLNLLSEPMRSWSKAYAMLKGKGSALKQDAKWIESSVEFFLNGAIKK